MKMSFKQAKEEYYMEKMGIELGKYTSLFRLGLLWTSARFHICLGVHLEHFPQRRDLLWPTTGSCHPPKDN